MSKRRKVAPTFWNPVSIKAPTSLSELRTTVIQYNEKRMPKWKFRLSPDLIVQIQPKLSAKFAELFECCAIEREGVTVESFIGKELMELVTVKLRLQDGSEEVRRQFDGSELKGVKPYLKLSFRLFRQDDIWKVQATYLIRSRWKPGLAEYDPGNLHDCLVAAFNDDKFNPWKPEIMLGYFCNMCGKALSDPASMSRRIGPECYGSASLNLDFVKRAVTHPSLA